MLEKQDGETKIHKDKEENILLFVFLGFYQQLVVAVAKDVIIVVLLFERLIIN